MSGLSDNPGCWQQGKDPSSGLDRISTNRGQQLPHCCQQIEHGYCCLPRSGLLILSLAYLQIQLGRSQKGHSPSRYETAAGSRYLVLWFWWYPLHQCLWSWQKCVSGFGLQNGYSCQLGSLYPDSPWQIVQQTWFRGGGKWFPGQLLIDRNEKQLYTVHSVSWTLLVNKIKPRWFCFWNISI